MIAGICTLPRLPCPSTKRHVTLNLTSAAATAAAAAAAAAAAVAAATTLRTAGWSCTVFFLFLPTLLRKLHGDGCCAEPSEKFRVRILIIQCSSVANVMMSKWIFEYFR